MANRLKNLNLQEISLVDQPANKGARVAVFKRDPLAKVDRDALVEVCKGVFDEDRTSDFREALADELQHQRVMEINEEMFPLMDALRESVMTAAAELSGEERDSRIRENVEQFLQSVRAKLDATETETVTARDPNADTETRGLVKRLAAHFGLIKADSDAGSPGANRNPSDKGDIMSEDLKKRLGDLESQVDQLTKERDENKSALDAVTKAVEDAGVKVEKADDGTVTAKVEKAGQAGDDETITAPDGTVLRKSEVGASHFAIIKSQNAEIEKMRDQAERADLRKRAEDRWPNVPGEPETKGQILKSIEALSDETARDAALGHYDQLNKSLGEQMKERGSAAHGDTGTEAMTKLDKMAKERAEKTGETKETAFAAIVKTDAGAELYDQYTRERAA